MDRPSWNRGLSIGEIICVEIVLDPPAALITPKTGLVWTASATWDQYSEIYLINEDEVSGFIDSAAKYVKTHGELPDVPHKMSEYNSLAVIYLIRYNDTEFAVFNRYLRSIKEISEFGYKFREEKL